MNSQTAMISLGTAAGIFTASRIFGPDFDLFSQDEPAAIEENPTMLDNLWNNPMMLLGITIAGIAMVAMSIRYRKMFTMNKEIPKGEEIPNGEEIPTDEPLNEKDDEDKTKQLFITNFSDRVNA